MVNTCIFIFACFDSDQPQNSLGIDGRCAVVVDATGEMLLMLRYAVLTIDITKGFTAPH